MPTTAKLTTSGQEQILRLPPAYWFNSEEIYIRRDPLTGDIILSAKSPDWQEYFALADAAQIAEDFMNDRDTRPADDKDLF